MRLEIQIFSDSVQDITCELIELSFWAQHFFETLEGISGTVYTGR